MTSDVSIAYFSAEIGFSPNVPTYSGGLGVLAGDYLKASADLGLPIMGITLLYREGYVKQKLDNEGKQTEFYPIFYPQNLLKKLPIELSIKLRGNDVKIAVWKYKLRGVGFKTVPIYFLDTDVEGNNKKDRKITHRLYSGGPTMRCLQEAVLGIGGVKLIEQLGHKIETYHLNEGHSAFLTLALKEKFGSDEEVKKHCVFTTHTPVPAGHDIFKTKLVKNILGDYFKKRVHKSFPKSKLNMTHLALYFCRYANGVSELHGEVSRKMFPKNEIDSITNGIHHLTWLGDETERLFDKYLRGWKKNPEKLLEVDAIPDKELWKAHQKNKADLLTYANSATQRGFSPDILTIGFGRRATGYKRAQLLFSDPKRLAKISGGKLQIIFSGKAHPKDSSGKEIIQGIFKTSEKLFESITIAYLENYNMHIGRLITSGVDVWLNTPQRPNEASGTSGMKAVLNGIPNLSILDGWWSEGCRDKENGWAIGDHKDSTDKADANFLYELLENEVIPTYYNDRAKWISLMKEAIKTAVDFTAQRMVQDYANKSYNLK